VIDVINDTENRMRLIRACKKLFAIKGFCRHVQASVECSLKDLKIEDMGG
jgi:hypothetical protein